MGVARPGTSENSTWELYFGGITDYLLTHSLIYSLCIWLVARLFRNTRSIKKSLNPKKIIFTPFDLFLWWTILHNWTALAQVSCGPSGFCVWPTRHFFYCCPHTGLLDSAGFRSHFFPLLVLLKWHACKARAHEVTCVLIAHNIDCESCVRPL